MCKTDVLVIGGSAAGIVAATTGKSFYPDKEFIVVRKDEQVLIPCGIPYIFGTLESSEHDLIHDSVLKNAGIKLKIDEVKINCEQNSLVYMVTPQGQGACHVKDSDGKSRTSCYYRKIEGNKLKFL